MKETKIIASTTCSIYVSLIAILFLIKWCNVTRCIKLKCGKIKCRSDVLNLKHALNEFYLIYDTCTCICDSKALWCGVSLNKFKFDNFLEVIMIGITLLDPSFQIAI